MSDEPGEDPPLAASGRAALLRDIAVLQVKLVVDGLRDLLLVPASLVVGLVSFVRGGPGVGREFYELLRLGRQSERWIKLFGALDRVQGEQGRERDDIERMVERVETFVVEEYRHGRLTGQAKQRLDRAVERMRQAGGRQLPCRGRSVIS